MGSSLFVLLVATLAGPVFCTGIAGSPQATPPPDNVDVSTTPLCLTIANYQYVYVILWSLIILHRRRRLRVSINSLVHALPSNVLFCNPPQCGIIFSITLSAERCRVACRNPFEVGWKLRKGPIVLWKEWDRPLRTWSRTFALFMTKWRARLIFLVRKY